MQSEFPAKVNKVGTNRCNFSDVSVIFSVISVPKYMKFTCTYLEGGQNGVQQYIYKNLEEWS